MDPARQYPYGAGNGVPYDHPYDVSQDAGEGSHTMVVPADVPPWADHGGEGYPAGYGARGRRARADEPFLQRWLFSRRLAYLAAVTVAVVGIGFLAWWLAAGRYVPVPSVAGLPEAAAVSSLRSDGFTTRVGPTVHDNTVPGGDVVSYTPSGNAGKGATVTLTLSSGPVMIKIPSISGQSFTGAMALLRTAGLTVSGRPQNVGQNGVAVGTVVGTNPPGGTSWPADKTVFVEVVAGPPMPDLVGQNAQSVQQNWAQPNGVTLVTETVTSTQPAGTIVSQSPAPGSVLSANESVTITVSSGPPTVSVPDISGQSLSQATQTLEQAGFVVSAHRFGFGQKVFYYAPAGTAPQGSTIDVYYGF
jgi:eukaryotic-like serine/threonine-protein kinase